MAEDNWQIQLSNGSGSACSHPSSSDDRLLISAKTCFSDPCKYMPMYDI